MMKVEGSKLWWLGRLGRTELWLHTSSTIISKPTIILFNSLKIKKLMIINHLMLECLYWCIHEEIR
jgi:hypothetical protein